MSAAVEDRPSASLPHPSSPPAELPSFGPFPPRTPNADLSSQKTPTQATFDAASKSRTSQPPSPAPAHFRSDSNRDRINAHRSNASLESIQSEIKTEDRDSENESDASDSRPSKKKKGQRFYCTDYPPCNLSFTRSEHLARHIRKHTGERPFQCHCMRRFSRLDNLRQHAQTVHVNEDIPGDSLAATGTRFQRQVRTDRVKTHRNRNSTLSAGGAHSRGHSRNMSGSSIGSVSDLGVADDARRRPPPLAMAQSSQRAGLAVDTYAANTNVPDAPYYNFSPSGYSTPMSAYSQDIGSPATQPASLNSPIHFVPRWEGRTPAHARRLSVPTQPSLFQQAALSAAGSVQHASHASQGHPQFTPLGSSQPSPASSTFPDTRPEQPESPESVWKRRTWHPSTAYPGPRPATSGLSYYQTPDTPQPIPASQPAAQQSIRLPGIETFDRAHVQPVAPPRRAPDMQDTPMRDAPPVPGPTETDSKRNSWSSINHHVSQMDIAAHAPPAEPAWQPAPPHGPRPVTAPYGSSGSAHLPPMEPSLAPSSQHPATPQRIVPQLFSSEPGPALIDESPNFRTSPAESASSENLPTPGNAPLLGQPPVLLHRDNSGELPPAHLVDEAARDKLRSEAAHHYFHPHPSTHPGPPQSGAPPAGMNALDTLAAVATRNAEQEGR